VIASVKSAGTYTSDVRARLGPEAGAQESISGPSLSPYWRLDSGLARLRPGLLVNRQHSLLGGVCGETDDAGEVEAEWEASGVSGGDEGYVRIDGLGITGASFDKGTREANVGIEEPALEFIYFPYFGGRMVRVLAGGVPLMDRVLDRRNQAGLELENRITS
jgi:hypothetical protein